MYWWTGNNIEIVEIDNRLYALDGWNGETYNHCWECADRYTVIDGKTEYIIRPIYKENSDGDFDIVGYEII